jgi:hypothetical protein
MDAALLGLVATFDRKSRFPVDNIPAVTAQA